ncbi:MAG TPA: ABC transporter permease [Mucilaginibacter sp.]|nr:ABC transporter permease [Mucilaginibacter sp.]
MIRNFLKIAWRNVIRHKAHAAINVTGLALGMTCCLFIFLWVQDEKGIDNFHRNGKNLYVLYESTTANGQVSGGYNMSMRFDTSTKPYKRTYLVEDAKTAVDGIADYATYATGYDLPWGHPETLQVGEKVVKMNGSRAGTEFFKMFSFPIIAGNNAATALSNRGNMAISRRTAEVFFGTPANAIGKSIRYENKYSFIVSSVFEDIPEHSSLKFDFVLSWELQDRMLEWSSNNFDTYIQLADGADPKQVEAALNRFLRDRLVFSGGFIYPAISKGSDYHLSLQRFGDRYLHNIFVNGKPTEGRIQYVQIFSEVAIFILIIACINFMNLATARSVKRAKEVGVRKVVGSSRANLIGQFFGESLVFSFLAMILSIILLVVLMPVFNSFTGKQFGFPLIHLSFWVSLISLALITGLVAGSYPALYLSSLKPVRILKGTLRFTRGAIWFRKGLTVFQFVLSILLLIATIVITRQTSYVQSAHLGYDKENMIYTRIEGELSKKNKYLLFKQELLKMPGVAMVDRTTEVPQAMNFVVNDDQITWQGKSKTDVIGVKPASVGFDFVKIMKLQMAAGRDFSPTNPTDSTDAFLVNEEAVREMGWRDAIGKSVQAWAKKGHIIGVLKDFHTQSLHEPIRPILLDIKEGEYFGVIVVRTQPGKTREAIASMARVYKDTNPKYPFSYQFVDQEYKKLYSSELIISQLSIVFAVVAIFISCLGLLGLVMFSAEQRIKEFGVRKVLGASLSQLMALFATDFLKLVFIAFLVAAPLGWYAMSRWLQDFAYKIDLSWWIFLAAGIGSLAIALFTLSYEAFKTAVANPVKNLRSE